MQDVVIYKRALSPAEINRLAVVTPKFFGTPSSSNCHVQSRAALSQQFQTLNAAAQALGFASVDALQAAIAAFCHG